MSIKEGGINYKMEKKEPYANQEEYKKRVIHDRDIPALKLFPNINVKTYLVSAEKLTVLFNFWTPNVQVPVHKHESEQILIVTDGACDAIVEGKLYHLEKGDVLILPSNIEHGVYASDKSMQTIEVFSPPRYDYVEKLEALKKSQK